METVTVVCGGRAMAGAATRRARSSKAPPPNLATGSYGGAMTGIATGHLAECGGDGRPRGR